VYAEFFDPTDLGVVIGLRFAYRYACDFIPVDGQKPQGWVVVILIDVEMKTVFETLPEGCFYVTPVVLKRFIDSPINSFGAN